VVNFSGRRSSVLYTMYDVFSLRPLSVTDVVCFILYHEYTVKKKKVDAGYKNGTVNF